MTYNFSTLLGDSLVGKDGKVVSTESLKSKEVVGLYFSAHWCPPCRGFTPVLAEVYEQLQQQGKSFEIVFVSSDSDDASFNDYFGSMPWLALPYELRDKKDALASEFGIRGIPTLVLLDGNGNVISGQGRTLVSQKGAAGFPFKA